MLWRQRSLASTLSLVTPSIHCSSSVDNPVKSTGGTGGGTVGNIISNKQFQVLNWESSPFYLSNQSQINFAQDLGGGGCTCVRVCASVHVFFFFFFFL
jgi:hypothetical protein